MNVWPHACVSVSRCRIWGNITFCIPWQLHQYQSSSSIRYSSNWGIYRKLKWLKLIKLRPNSGIVNHLNPHIYIYIWCDITNDHCNKTFNEEEARSYCGFTYYINVTRTKGYNITKRSNQRTLHTKQGPSPKTIAKSTNKACFDF